MLIINILIQEDDIMVLVLQEAQTSEGQYTSQVMLHKRVRLTRLKVNYQLQSVEEEDWEEA